MLQKYILIALFCFFGELAWSQNPTISGIVVDEAGTPIEGASIRIDGDELDSRTDKTGYFLITVLPNSTYNLRFSYAKNYTNIKVRVGDDPVENMTITIQDKTLNQIEIVQVRPTDFVDGFPPVDFSKIPTS